MRVLSYYMMRFNRILILIIVLICVSVNKISAQEGAVPLPLESTMPTLSLPTIEIDIPQTLPLDLRFEGGPYKGLIPPSIYSLPYSPYTSVPNWRRLWTNTATLLSAGGAALIVLKALPQNSTAWSRLEEKEVPMGQRWIDHVKEGPVWDHDNVIFNYILHPYGGAAYYMSARSCGFNIWGSFLYSFCVSTFFWEYGVEAFMEIPSVQDLVITPVIGALFGEGFYHLKRMIVDRGYRVLGTPIIGHFLTFLLDPVNEVVNLFYPDRQLKSYVSSITSTPMITGNSIGLSVAVTF